MVFSLMCPNTPSRSRTLLAQNSANSAWPSATATTYARLSALTTTLAVPRAPGRTIPPPAQPCRRRRQPVLAPPPTRSSTVSQALLPPPLLALIRAAAMTSLLPLLSTSDVATVLLLSPVASLPASPSCSKVLGIELVAVWGAGGCSRANFTTTMRSDA